MATDMVNHPPHYTSHPSGVECIQITEWMGFNLGNALKYIWRADLKGNVLEDLEKAAFYVNREIKRRKGLINQPGPSEPIVDTLDDADKDYVWIDCEDLFRHALLRAYAVAHGSPTTERAP